MRTAKRILAEFMTVVMVLQACSPTVAAVAAGWQNISSEIATAAAEASDTAESGETKSDATTGSGSSDTGAAGDSAEDDAAKDDAAASDTSDSAAGSDSADDQTEGDDTAGDAAADDAEQDADDEASEGAAAQANATITDLAELVRLLEANGAEHIVCKENGSGIQSLDVTVSTAFTVLSNADASFYYDAQININMSGDAKLIEPVDDGRLSFQGFGSDAHPFEGKIYSSNSPDDPVELTANRTVFNNLKLTDQNKTVKIKWVGATNYSAPMVASKISGEGKKLNATVDIADPVGNDKGNDKTSALTAPLLGETTGALNVSVTYSLNSLTGSRKNLNVSADGNIGLIANMVESGTLTVESVTLPNDLASGGTVKTSSGNAGLLVGEVKDGATLSIGTLTNVPTVTVQSTNGSAGGVVGLVGSSTGAMVNVTEALDLHALTVKGTTASGGFIGKATVLTLGADNKQIRCPLNIGDENSACSGGVIGDVSFARGFTVKPNMFDLGDLVTLGASQRAGALFGVADISNGDIVVQGGTYKSRLASGKDGTAPGSYGGLAGKVFATAKGDNDVLRAFVVQKDADNKNACSIEFDLASGLSHAGGVVGYVGDTTNSNSQPVAVVLNGVKVACKGDASARTTTGKLGGAVGVVDTRSVLDVRDFTLTSDNAIGGAANNRAAGIAGSAWNAVIKFSGITNLSGARFAANGTTGQLVYENNNALIFAIGNGSNGNVADKGATGWTYKRSGAASKTDDITTYGEVIRLGDSFIALDPITHKLTLPAPLALTDGAYSLASVKDFAKLAITWQTNGYYSMVEGVTENNLNGLKSSTITVNGTIDLAGTGLTGFTQDRASDSQVFSGTLNGNGTIKLAVGEAYGMRGNDPLGANDTSAGNGKIYRHGRLGLFAAINDTTADSETVSNVTIAGSMKFDNGSAIDAGSLAGTVVGGLTLSGATCETNITCDDTFANDANVVNIGGIAGSVSAASTVTFKGNSKAQATIATTNTLKGNIRIGGAIGYVGNYVSTFNVTGLEVSGKIETGNCDNGKIAQIGGLIGGIAQSSYNNGTIANSANKNVNIWDLSFNSFKMGVGKNGDKLNGVGGLLGYSWGNAVVTIGDDNINKSENSYALKTTNASIIATVDDSKELGGLVYAASGHWIINNYAIDLSGTKINAGAAQTLGVLVCRGCKVDDKTTYGVESYLGLYLEDRAYWDTAYRVPTGEGAIVASGVTSFDEWVGSGVKPNNGSKLMDADWNTVVSLHTQKNKLDMDGDSTKDNSYHNRSSFGRSQNTNGNTRYFYNLDIASKNCEGGFSGSQIDTADKLLLWSAFCYAPAGIRSTIVPDGTTGLDDSITITGTIDLAGYSYYPTQPIGEVTVNNAAITFYYSKIKAEQNGNKLNSDATQHENMHCGLFQTVADGDLTVSNVTLGGTVGPVINDGKSSTDAIGAGGSSSGALVCRYVYGSSDGNGIKIRKISIDDLTLNNLIVDGANSATDANAYMPLLINEMQKYVSLNAKNIKTTGYTSGTKAATSLFGKLGVGSEADQVTAKFEQISLPSQENNTIFTHASLLESFGYGSTSTGSADYTFTNADATAGKVTYGSEIDARDKEYSGKQLWYYDETTYGTDSGLVTVDNKQASVTNPRFGDYLPYVYKGKATEDGVQYHEIKVNQRIPKLVTGCGTYGDPYSVTNAAEMNAIANYINNMTALDGWEVTIVADQGRLCTRRSSDHSTDNEVTYVYKQANGTDNKWEKKIGDASTNSSQTLSDETMHRYMQSAYYSIEPTEGNTITLDGASFGGFGNRANPFRGVIVGNFGSDNKNATIKIENNKGSLRGLIPYSYGSVVRSLNINYVNAHATITYSEKDADGVPTAFFGGVIGCILGGDNIIDHVAVNETTTENPTTRFTVTGGGDNPHLVPIGGYVGAIAGGGVIFRNMDKSGKSSWRAGTGDKSRGLGKGNFDLYNNPYVGRVIDGYAFSEGCPIDNGDANYKINELNVEDTGCVTTTDTYMKFSWWENGRQNNNAPQTTVKDSQGLLVLSAIINSGAGAGAAHTNVTDGRGTYRGSHAYEGSSVIGDISSTGYKFGNERYGKVRNANYAAVGKPADAAAASDFATSVNDDLKAPGNQEYQGPLNGTDGQVINSPYLVKKYATDWRTGYVCAMGVCGMNLQFEQGAPYDMRDYGSGFLGLSGRYYSNACATDKKVNDKDFITPGIATINGNGATIKVKNNTREYVDDDYNIAGVGGLFSTIKFYSNAFNKGSIEANDNANVSNLNFEDCNISLAYVSSTGAEQSTSTSNTNSGSVGVGCLAGSTANQGASSDVAYGVFKNVSISNSTVAGGCTAGGLIGSAGLMSRSTDGANGSIVNYGGTSSPVQLYDCSYTGLNVTGEKRVGGYVGSIASPCGVWTTVAEGVSEKTVGANSTMTATGLASECRVGGVFGYTSSNVSVNTDIGTTKAAVSRTAVISKVDVLITGATTEQSDDQLKNMGAGGVIGSAYGGVISMSNVRIDTADGTENAAIGDKTGGNSKIRNAGGLIGKVTSGGSGSNKYWFEGCSVKNVNVSGTNQCSGGLIGYFFSNVNIACNNIAIENATIKGSWSGGLLGANNASNSGSVVIDVTNTKVSNTTFSGASNGGIMGDGRGQFHLVNVLMDSNSYNAGKTQGVLLGEVDTGDGKYSLSAAGVEVKPGSGKTTSDLPPMVYTTNTNTAAVNEKTYIAFGDYNGTAAAPNENKTLYGAGDTATTATSPYVTTRPVSTLAVRASDGDTTDRYLFGDGAAIATAAAIQSEVIQSKAGTSFPGRYTYTNIGGINDNGAYQNTSSYNAKSVESTFNANNDASGNQVTKEKNFPVLVISGTDNKTVTSYLNIITNGGFSDACRLNNENGTNEHVTAKAEVFQLKNGVFVKDEEASNNPTLRVVNNGKKNMSFSPSSDWDNGKGRFTLLTVTFSEAGQSYNVQVPIIVKRKLEIDFTATYDYGTNFKESNYANLGDGDHVLTSFGEPMTGLLTWTYNSAKGKEVDFGWDSYMAAGGSMKGLGKSILFDGADGRLPQGTQLTLVDANVDGKAGGREYHYKVGEGGATSVSLSGDDGFKDSAGNPYQERWLSEILGVSATQDGAGAWTVCGNDDKADATAKAKLGDTWTLFKVAGADVPSKNRYTLKVPKDKYGKEKRASESVYLVVNVPKSAGVSKINGFTNTPGSFDSSSSRVAVNMHPVLRPNNTSGGKDADIQNNTASTYSILSNYGQEVADNEREARTLVSQSQDGAAYVLSLDVTDTITFNTNQIYAKDDSLFYRLDTSLCQYDDNTLRGVSSFPSGTSAIAEFYVAIGSQCYTWNSADKKWVPCDASTPAFTQTVTDTGNDSLKLTLEHNLAGIRARANGSFTVRTVVKEIRLTPDGCNDVIALSQESGKDACTKMSYIAKLSTRKSGLDTSSLAVTMPGNVGYYRMNKGGATITLSAPDKSQLGINVDDLRPIANGTIGLGATYELGGLNNATEAIKKADSVVYTLTLQRRSVTGGSYEDVTDGISNYVTVTESKLATVSDTGNAITFTDTKKDGAFGTKNGDTTFNLPFTVKVNTQAEQRDQFYANYRLVMTASLVTGSTASATPQSPDYVTYTLTRVNLNGIDHSN